LEVMIVKEDADQGAGHHTTCGRRGMPGRSYRHFEMR
jgi:hypothetical protein